jgi:hypothetical protein
VARHDINLVTLDLARKRRLRLHRYDAHAQWRCHAVHVIFVQTPLLPNLLVGKVQAHPVQAPDPQRQGGEPRRSFRSSRQSRGGKPCSDLSGATAGSCHDLAGSLRATHHAGSALPPASAVRGLRRNTWIVQKVLKVKYRANILKA